MLLKDFNNKFLNYKVHVLFIENYRLQETYENHLIIKLVSVSVFFLITSSLKLSESLVIRCNISR